MLHISRYLPFALAITFASLSSRPNHSIGANALNYSTGIFGRHLAVYPASSVGRMDRSGCYNSHPGKWYCNMRNAENLGEQKSSKEEDS